MTGSLFTLDRLPGHSRVEMEESASIRAIDRKGRVRIGALRFRAIDHEGRISEWSGWFSAADAPIVLSWDAFTWPT